MAEGALRIVGAAPSGRGLLQAVRQRIKPQTMVGVLHPGYAHQVKSLLPDEEDRVAPFHELASRFWSLTDGAEDVFTLSSRQILLLTGEAVSSLSLTHQLFTASAGHPGFHRVLAETLSELRLHQVTADRLREWAQAASPSLSAKLLALADVEDQVRKLAEAKGRILPSQAFENCLDAKIEHLIGQFRHLIIVAGRTPEPLIVEWCRWAAQQGADIDLIVEALPRPSRLFRGFHSPHLLDKGARLQAPPPHWTESLFSSFTSASPLSVQLHSAIDPLAESEWVLRACQDYLAEGLTTDDIAIYCRDNDTYGPLLESASQRLGVQVSLRTSAPLLANGYVRALLGALRAVASGEPRNLIRLSKSSYFPASADEQDQIKEAAENACREEDPWSAMLMWAKDMEFARGWLLPLLTWKLSTAGSRSLLAWRDSLGDLAGKSTALEAAVRQGPTKERDKRAMGVMQQVLADVHFASGGRMGELSLSHFLTLAERLWKGESVYYPEKRSGIKVVNQTEQLGEYQVVAALGMLEGVFPKRRREDPILFDEEREELTQISGGWLTLLSSEDKASEERDDFVRLCASPSQALILSYPESSEDSDQSPTMYLDELARATNRPLHLVRHRPGDFTPPPELCRGNEVWLAEALLQPAESLPETLSLSTLEGKDLVTLREEQRIDVTAIESSLQCPFRAQAQKILKWSGEESRDLFRIIRSVPEECDALYSDDFDSLRTKLSLRFDQKVDQVIGSVAPWQIEILRASKESVIQSWIVQEEMIDGAGHPTLRWRFSTFNSDFIRTEVPVLGRKLLLTGSVVAHGEWDGLTYICLPTGSFTLKTRGSLPVEEHRTQFLPIFHLALLGKTRALVECRSSSGVAQRIGIIADQLPRPLRHDDRLPIKTGKVDTDALSGSRAFLAEAVKPLFEGEMTAKPGEHCDWCRFGELCRRSKDFGERTDLFDLGGRAS